MLLPLLTAVIVAQGSEAAMEQQFSDGVRARIADGWTIADVRTEGNLFVATISHGDEVERHFVGYDDKGRYALSIERDAKVPADPREPSELALQALTSPRGGIEVHASCGEYYELPYFIESFAGREMAPRFVASTLATADDLSYVDVRAHQTTFHLERNGKAMKLFVWLGEGGAVIEAQLRYYGAGVDGTATYKRTRAMTKALSHGRVTKIEAKAGLRLVTTKGTFAIDPDGSAFEGGGYSGEYEGCGC
jgi:hypothetical protein